jgi:hypothetical protein
MTRDEFEKRWFLLKITYSDVINGISHFQGEEWVDKTNDWNFYTNECHLLYNEYLFGYLNQNAPREYTKMTDFKKLKEQINKFEQLNNDILWMDENDPSYPEWRLYLEERYRTKTNETNTC